MRPIGEDVILKYKRPELEYASYRVIQRHGNSKQRVSAMRFHKLMFLLNRELLKEGIDMRLPQFWYFYGPVVSILDMPKPIRFDEKSKDEFKTNVYWEGKKPSTDRRRLPKKVKQIIDKKLMSVDTKHPPSSDVWELVRAVYDYAPYDFQREYRTFWSDSEAQPSFGLEKLAAKVLIGDFRQSMKAFPDDDFSSLRIPRAKLSYVVETIFKDFPKERQIGIRMSKAFWEIFCKHLRLSKEGHENLSEKTIDFWKTNLELEFVKYEDQLEKDIKYVVDNLQPDRLSDPMLTTFLLPGDWGPGSEKASEEIDTMLYR